MTSQLHRAISSHPGFNPRNPTRSRAPRRIAVLFVLALSIALLPVGSRADHRTMEVHPETSAANPVGTTVQLTAQLDEALAAGFLSVDFEITGPGDPDSLDSDSPTTPDATCTISAGQDDCQVPIASTVVGTQL